MMFLLTEDARLICSHVNGKVDIVPSQELVRADTRLWLVEVDPEGREINGCPNIGVGIRPCKLTLKVKVGYSDLLRIDDRRVCLDTVSGLTDGTPPGTVRYRVAEPGQQWIQEAP